MTFQPRNTDDVLDDLESNLKGKIEKLTNFTRRSFNFVFARAFAREVRKTEVRNLASELSGFIEYSGGPVTQNDLDNLGVTGVDPSEVNEFMSDEFLDEYVKIVGIRRFEGVRASGSITIETQVSRTVIPEETIVTTELSDGETVRFETTSEVVSEDGATVLQDVSIQSVKPGQSGNVPANTIVKFENPPVGVRSVTNTEPTTGGEEAESNEELRTRAKNAVQSASEGGTTDGIRGFLRKNIEGVGQGDVFVDEFVDRQPPEVDVVVDGGIREDVIDGIEESRPTGIRHSLIRPQTIQIGFDTSLTKNSSVDTQRVEDNIQSLLLQKGIGEDFLRDEAISEIFTSDNRIENIESLGAFIERVTNEEFIFTEGKTRYELDFTYDNVSGSISITDSENNTFTEGVDFTVIDTTGDGFVETIEWQSSADRPDIGERFTVDYDVTLRRNIVDSERKVFKTGKVEYKLNYIVEPDTSVDIVGNDDTDYTQGIDFTITSSNNSGLDTISWDTSKSTPDNKELFFVSYDISDLNKTKKDDVRLTNNVRDEQFRWNLDFTESEDYETQQDIYELLHVPFPSSVTSITDNDGNTFSKGTDFELIDDSGNGFRQSIDWSIGGQTPNDNVVFDITYDQMLYRTNNDIISSGEDIIRDEDGTVYDRKVDYTLESYSDDINSDDAIVWDTVPTGVNDNDEFYMSYVSEGDIIVLNREKLSAGTISVGVL